MIAPEVVEFMQALGEDLTPEERGEFFDILKSFFRRVSVRHSKKRGEEHACVACAVAMGIEMFVTNPDVAFAIKPPGMPS